MGRDMMRLRRGILLNTPHVEQASGAIATFETDMAAKLKEAVISFEPQQDLHGYDAPWPPGGGKNKFNVNENEAVITGWNVKFPFTITAGTYIMSCQQQFGGDTNKGASVSLRDADDNNLLTFTGYDFGNTIFSGPSRNVTEEIAAATTAITFGCRESMNSAKAASILNAKIQLEIGSTASAFAPYSNECPITGWSEAKVYDDPKYNRTVWWNQLTQIPSSDRSAAPSGVTITDNRNGSYTLNGTATAGFNFRIPDVNYTNGHKYLIHSHPNVCITNDMGYNANKGSKLQVANASRLVLFSFYVTKGSVFDNVTVFPFVCDLTAMFGAGNEPATVADFRALFPLDYYAYNAGEETLVSAINGDPYRAVTIDLNGTRYGGTVDVVSGTMRVDRAKTMYTSELSISNWYSHDADYDTWGFYSNYDTRWQTVIGLRPVGGLIADKMPTASSSYGTDRLNCSLILQQTGANAGTMHYMAFRIPKSLLPTPTDSANLTTLVKAWLDENPIEISFKIAPFTVQLTPAQLRAIKGQNNIFADCGDVAVKYWKH